MDAIQEDEELELNFVPEPSDDNLRGSLTQSQSMIKEDYFSKPKDVSEE